MTLPSRTSSWTSVSRSGAGGALSRRPAQADLDAGHRLADLVERPLPGLARGERRIASAAGTPSGTSSRGGPRQRPTGSLAAAAPPAPRRTRRDAGCGAGPPLPFGCDPHDRQIPMGGLARMLPFHPNPCEKPAAAACRRPGHRGHLPNGRGRNPPLERRAQTAAPCLVRGPDEPARQRDGASARSRRRAPEAGRSPARRRCDHARVGVEARARASARRGTSSTTAAPDRLADLGWLFLAPGEAVAPAADGGEELLQVDLERGEDLVRVVLGARAESGAPSRARPR